MNHLKQFADNWRVMDFLTHAKGSGFYRQKALGSDPGPPTYCVTWSSHPNPVQPGLLSPKRGLKHRLGKAAVRPRSGQYTCPLVTVGESFPFSLPDPVS